MTDPHPDLTETLGHPTIEFHSVDGVVRARSIKDHRWFKVQGITKTLNCMSPQTRTGHQNMINMDIFNRALQDLHKNPGSKLEWIVDYIQSLNVNKKKARSFQAAMLRLFESNKVPSLMASRRVWDKACMSTYIGTAVDSDCKDVYNGKKTREQVGPVARLVLAQLEALLLTPICGGLRVACVPSPDVCSINSDRYTYHNQCTEGCRGIRSNWGFFTEVDMIAYDPVTNRIVLLELKTRHNDVLDRAAIWRYNTQLWLTWLMFSITYPAFAERTSAYLVIVRPGTNVVHIRPCMKPSISKSMRLKFPWLTCFCTRVLNYMTPTCTHMKFQRGKQHDVPLTNVIRSDLAYRNVLFNQEKAKMKRKQHQQQQQQQ